MASEGHILNTKRLSLARFEHVVFSTGGVALATGGVALATPYKHAKMPKLLAWSPIFSHTKPTPLTRFSMVLEHYKYLFRLIFEGIQT